MLSEAFSTYSLVMLVVLSHFSHVQLFVTPWTVACQAPLSMGFSRKNTQVGCWDLLQGTFLPKDQTQVS